MPSSDDTSNSLIDFCHIELYRNSHRLVGPLDWAVTSGQHWVILGPNGAGKTSLLQIAAGMEHPTRGQASLLGQQLGTVDMMELRTRIGLSSSALAQRIPSNEIVSDLVISAGYAVVGRWREHYDQIDYIRAINLLEEVGSEHLVSRQYGTLSEGERKRVLVARALMSDPELLLLDEPAAGLDLGGREELIGYLSDLAANPQAPAIVLVTHHVEEIPPGFTHCLLLTEGQQIACGPLAEVITEENLSQLFEQEILLTRIDDRYFARRKRLRAAHRKSQ